MEMLFIFFFAAVIIALRKAKGLGGHPSGSSASLRWDRFGGMSKNPATGGWGFMRD